MSVLGTSPVVPASGEWSNNCLPEFDAKSGEKPCSLLNVLVLEPHTSTLLDANSLKADPGDDDGRRYGFLYASGFNPGPNKDGLPGTPTKTQDTNATKPALSSHDVTPSVELQLVLQLAVGIPQPMANRIINDTINTIWIWLTDN